MVDRDGRRRWTGDECVRCWESDKIDGDECDGEKGGSGERNV